MNFDFKCGVICHFPYNISTNHYLLPFPLRREHNPLLDLWLSVLTFSKSFTFPSPSFAFLSISSGTGICSFSLNMCLMLGCANVNTPLSLCVFQYVLLLKNCNRILQTLPLSSPPNPSTHYPPEVSCASKSVALLSDSFARDFLAEISIRVVQTKQQHAVG